MPQREIAGAMIDFDDEGFMTDHTQWNEDIARALAKEEGIEELTDRHMAVINFM
ncbi:MAG: TusE/DsrC/DsvC family sulfur relay protein, partial [Chlorobi bacterium]|nr:TusE/DsrC/DsvC family sulfur relay protein [Chlorobiota bacterium]